MAKLDDMSREMGNPGYGLFSSHPEPEVRMAKALKWLEPLHITPTVSVAKDGSATVRDGSWSYRLTETAGYDKPTYRAYLMAGAMYLAKTRAPLDESHFLTVDGDTWSDIYYEDIRVLRVYPQDNQQTGSTSDLALDIAGRLQQWAEGVLKAAPAGNSAQAVKEKQS